jgi:hypothetical protein
MAATATGDAAGVRVSRVGLGAVAGGVQGSLEDVLAGLGPHENVIELVVAEAVLTVSGCSGRALINELISPVLLLQCCLLANARCILCITADTVRTTTTSCSRQLLTIALAGGCIVC